MSKFIEFIKRIFKVKIPFKSTNEQLKEAIEQCDTTIFKYKRDIYLLRQQTVNMLKNTFIYDKKFAYEELEHLDEIFEGQTVKDINKSLLDETISICLSYKQQSEIRKIKIDATIKQKETLIQMLEQYLETETKLEVQHHLSENIKLNSQKIQEISDLDSGNEIEIKLKTELLEKELLEIKHKLAEIKEFNKQLNMLYNKYSKENKPMSLNAYQEQLKKILER